MIVVIELLVKSSIIDSRSRNNVDADPANFGLFCKSQDKTFLNNFGCKTSSMFSHEIFIIRDFINLNA